MGDFIRIAQNLNGLNQHLETVFPLRGPHLTLYLGHPTESSTEAPVSMRGDAITAHFTLVLWAPADLPGHVRIENVTQQEVALWSLEDLPIRWDHVHRFIRRLSRVVERTELNQARLLFPADLIDRVPHALRVGA